MTRKGSIEETVSPDPSLSQKPLQNLDRGLLYNDERTESLDDKDIGRDRRARMTTSTRYLSSSSESLPSTHPFYNGLHLRLPSSLPEQVTVRPVTYCWPRDLFFFTGGKGKNHRIHTTLKDTTFIRVAPVKFRWFTD